MICKGFMTSHRQVVLHRLISQQMPE